LLINKHQEVLCKVGSNLQQRLCSCKLQIKLGVLRVNQMEVFGNNSCEEPFISQLLFVEVINQE
jgi:hypothetical protein